MHSTILATFFEISRTAIAMCSAGFALFFIGVWAAKNEIAEASGLDKVVAPFTCANRIWRYLRYKKIIDRRKHACSCSQLKRSSIINSIRNQPFDHAFAWSARRLENNIRNK